MFVRWQQLRSVARFEHVREHKDRAARLRAILVESVRVDGEPRQRHVAFLASIPRDQTNDGLQRAMFWHDIRRALDKLGDRITHEERAGIEAAIAQRVEPPAPAEQEAFERQRRAFLARFGR